MLRTVIIASVLATISALTVDQAHDVIRKSFAPVNLQAGLGQLCQANTCCNITTTSACSITNMEKDKSTLVLPGGETR